MRRPNLADWSRVKDLFGATFEASNEERQQRLRNELDVAVRTRVERLLQAHTVGSGPLDRPAIDALAGIDPSRLTPVRTLVGRKLGPYHIVREIAHGGMGAVYEGVRVDQQFDQRVAIKTLLLGANSSTVLERFRRERQILAGLQHPNIAPLYDGAITDDGLPYFVLEYIDGLPIDRHCTTQVLDLPARLALFRQVVSAVQHAHRQLVIHRDLKPSNVLVRRDGVVKLVDFGIAKVLQPESRDVTVDPHGPITLSYASPEQVKGEPITTAADVYSLGVLLYRLLTGRTPLDVGDLSLERAVSIVCNDTPMLPSEAAEPQAAASMGFPSVDRLRRTLRGDLDAIIMMALRKEPERRYATAQALGDDLDRYRRGLPVAAAPDTRTYRLRKFAQRQRTVVSAAVLGAAAIVLGAGVAIWQAQSARVEARRARAVSQFLESVIGAGDVSSASPGARLGPAATVAQLLDSASRRLPAELTQDPQGRAQIHLALGRAYLSQERWLEAESQFRAAREVAETRLGGTRLELARALEGLAEVSILTSGGAAASLGRRSLEIYESVGATRSVEYAHALRIFGAAQAFAGRWPQADSVLARALAVHEQLGPRPTVERAMAFADRAAVRVSLGRSWDSTIVDYRKALAMLDSVPGAEVVEKGSVLWYAADAEASVHHIERADSLALESLHVFERAAGPTSPLAAQELVQLAGFARARGDLAHAREYVDRALAIAGTRPEMHAIIRERIQLEAARLYRATHALDSAETLARAAYGTSLTTGNSLYIAQAGQLFGSVLGDAGKYGEAESRLVDAYTRSVAVMGKGAGFSLLTAGSLVRLYYAWGRPAAAEPYLATLPDSVQRTLRTTARAKAAR